MLAEDIERIVDEVLHEKVQEALANINSRLPISEWRSNGTIEKIDGGYNLWFDNELIIFYDFGTGNFSKSYLSDKPKEFQDEAMKFFVNGLGKTPAHDVIIPEVTRVLVEVQLEVDKRVEEWFKSVTF